MELYHEKIMWKDFKKRHFSKNDIHDIIDIPKENEYLVNDFKDVIESYYSPLIEYKNPSCIWGLLCFSSFDGNIITYFIIEIKISTIEEKNIGNECYTYILYKKPKI